MTARQLPLDLGHTPALGGEDFLVAAPNAQAVEQIGRWPDWPDPVLALTGPAASGKSHLAALFAQRSGARVAAAADLDAAAPPRLLDGVAALVLEDCDAQNLDETALFHLINLVRQDGRWLLLTARQPPSRWPVSLPDLRSRLNALQVAGIGAPDESLLAPLLVKLLADRQLRIGEEVLSYLLARMDRSFAAARRMAEALDQASLAERRPLTIGLARRVLEGLPETDERQEELFTRSD